MRERRLIARAGALAAGSLMALAFWAPQAGAGEGPPTYEVTFTNLTDAQPLTPPVAATHEGTFHVFEFRREARFGVQQIAENGNNGPLLTFLSRRSRVADSLQGGMGPLLPAGTPGGAMFPDSVTFPITSDGEAGYFSLVSMLVCTNDGFTGVDSLALPEDVGDVVSYMAPSYDSRTERNTQDLADIVPPCQPLIGVFDGGGDPGTGESDPALRTHGVVRMHKGIHADRGDLTPEDHGWTDPVAEIEVERIA